MSAMSILELCYVPISDLSFKWQHRVNSPQQQ